MKKIKYTIFFAVVIFAGMFFGLKQAQAATGCGTEYGSTYNGQSGVPSTMVSGTSTTINLTFGNCGWRTWTEAEAFKLGSQNPENNNVWQAARIYLYQASSKTVPMDGVTTFSFPITAPTTPGTYNLQFRMLREGITWFGDYTPNFVITVTAPPQPPTCSSAGPEGAVEPYGTTSHNVYAYGVANTSQVLFPARRIGVDSDWVWWPGSNLGGGTWLGTVPTASTFSGAVWVHVYLNGTVFCGSANYTISAPTAPVVSIAAVNSNIAYGSSTGIYWSSSGYVSSCSTSPLNSTALSMPYPGHPTGALYATTTYTTSCTGPGGTTSASATVTVTPPPSPTCSSAGPDGVTEPYGATTHTVNAYNVSNATRVLFPTWTDTGGQDDIVWYEVLNPAATASVSIPLNSHPGTGTVRVHVYLYNQYYSNVFCDSADFIKAALTAPSAPVISGAPACTLSPYTITVSWSGSADPGFGYWVDISANNFASISNKNVTSATSTVAPTGFSPTLTLSPGTTYYVRVYNGLHSPTTTFTVPYCATSCTGVTPVNQIVRNLSGGFNFAATGVANAFYVLIRVSDYGTDANPREYWATNNGGGTWSANINLANHPGFKQFAVNAYAMHTQSAWGSPCASTSFTRPQQITINSDQATSWVINGPGGPYTSSTNVTTQTFDLKCGNYTVTPATKPGYTATVTPTSFSIPCN